MLAGCASGLGQISLPFAPRRRTCIRGTQSTHRSHKGSGTQQLPPPAPFHLRTSDFGLRFPTFALPFRHDRTSLFRRVLPPVNLLPCPDKDLRTDARHTILGNVNICDVANATNRLRQRTQDREIPDERDPRAAWIGAIDRKSTRLNSSHLGIS